MLRPRGPLKSISISHHFMRKNGGNPHDHFVDNGPKPSRPYSIAACKSFPPYLVSLPFYWFLFLSKQDLKHTKDSEMAWKSLYILNTHLLEINFYLMLYNKYVFYLNCNNNNIWGTLISHYILMWLKGMQNQLYYKEKCIVR